MVGQDYNLIQVFDLIARLTLQRHFGLRLPGISREESPVRALICSQALMDALGRTNQEFQSLFKLSADQNRFGSASIQDFIRIHQRKPDLLSKVELPSWAETEPAEDEEQDIDDDVAIWSSSATLIRATLIHLVPEMFRARLRLALKQVDEGMRYLPVPVPTFVYFAILVAVCRRYPIPSLLALLPLLRPPSSKL
eukprot:CRZ01652.1 hypothetical protein [Spongospora subterranea]